ncbi:hypothetical protein AK830_g1253 [Neonectria ditissima]|uniref:Uncharacterized protein n=1 Tax=Neonectria ditissima TaxID=78410 RepID=A0A0P7BUP2_9HYPO|nr:hypothetical protein AK830_g1253 [Neonectria ditissima]
MDSRRDIDLHDILAIALERAITEKGFGNNWVDSRTKWRGDKGEYHGTKARIGPQVIDDLRREIVAVIGEGGWKKTSLHNLKLMDSVLKESQRPKPHQIVGMHRRAMEDVELSDGTKLARRSATAGSAERMWDPSFYQNPNGFDGYRFYQAGGSSGDAANQLVTTSTRHMGFGHSMHSCPDRFFASNEAKVVLCHLLLKYDFKMAASEKPKVARSQEEIDLSAQSAES